MQGKSVITAIALAVLAGVSARAEVESAPGGATEVVISIADQKLVLLRDGMRLAQFKVSTSKFGAGDSYGSYKTPLGRLRVCDKVGEMLSCGSVIKHRNATGEVLPVNAPGRDPIVTRIIWLDGQEERNKNAKARGIYIHGTVEESKIGSPVSYGCIRMKSREVMELFEQVPVGTIVSIQQEKLPKYQRWTPPEPVVIAAAKPPAAPKSAAAPGKPGPAVTASAKPATKPAIEPVVVTKTSGPVVAAVKTPSRLIANSPSVGATANTVADSEREEAVPRVIQADPGAAESLRGSILFADLPRLKPQAPVVARPAASRAPASAPALEPVGEGPHSEPAAGEAQRVTFRTGHSAGVAQRLP